MENNINLVDDLRTLLDGLDKRPELSQIAIAQWTLGMFNILKRDIEFLENQKEEK